MSIQMQIVTTWSRNVIKPILARTQNVPRGRRALRLFIEPVFLRPRGFWQKTGTLGGVPGLWCGAGRPRPKPEDGLLLYVHGGGFCFGSPESHAHLAADLAGQTGRVAFLPRYRLAPEHPFPAGLDDVCRSFRAACDLGPVVLAGDSAGGNLSLATLARALQNGWALPQGVAALSPVCDLTFSGGSIRENARTEALLPRKGIAPLLEAYLAGHPADDPFVSPLVADMAGAPPVRIIASASEILRDDAVRMAGHLAEAGAEASLRLWPDCLHAWPILRGSVPEANEAVADIAQFIRHLG